jgi:type III pantothenate kinase
MILALDCGNSRIKLGLHHSSGWVSQQSVALDDAAALDAAVGPLLDKAGDSPRVVACNVAGPAVQARVQDLLARHGLTVRWLLPSRAEGGVTNRYEQPERLGADRWAALVGARGLHAGAAVVACAGTALTIDTLTAGGDFTGGVILPGIALMKRSLAGGTAQLPLAQGGYAVAARNTADAIESGVLDAACGALARHLARVPGARLLLTGGDAAAIAAAWEAGAQLGGQGAGGTAPQVVDNLVLEGLVRVAG